MANVTKQLARHLAELGRRGGKARLKKMTAEKRQEVARHAAQTRWSKKKETR